MPRIQVYTTRWCAYCVRAKALLDSRGLDYEEISLDDDPSFRQRLFDLTGAWTVPQVLIDGRPIGGYVELWQLDRRGELERPAARGLRGEGRDGAPPFVTTPVSPAHISPVVSRSKPVAVCRASDSTQGAGERGWQSGQYQVPRPAARIFSTGVPQRSHGWQARP